MDEWNDKPRTYRERKTFSKKDIPEKDWHGKVHTPYKRPTKDVLKNVVEEDSEQV